MQLHHAATGRPDQHGYSLGHSHQTGPYPMHSFSGPPSSSVAGGIDVRSARDSGSTGVFLHPGTSGDGGEAVRALGNNMGVMSAASPPSAPPTSRRDGYPDVAVARQCEREGCNVQPSYGKVWKKPRFCARHKLPGMMDVRNRRCEEPNCTRQPSYGKEGQRRQFCFTHKREGDVDVKSTRCKSTGCPKHAMYGRPGEMPQYCSAHKAEDMVDVKKRRRCNADNCERRASYALDGEKAAFCSAHKQAGHVNVNNRRCEFHGCSRRPVFSFQGEKPRFCLAHKLDGMQDSRLNAEGRGRARAGAASRPSQVAAAQQRMYGGQNTGGYGRGGGGGGGGRGMANGNMGGGGATGVNGDMMFGARANGDMKSSMLSHGGGGIGVPHRNVQERATAAQATVSAAAAVIAAIEDEARLDSRGHAVHGVYRNGGGGFRESDVDVYESLQHGGGFGGGGGGGGSMARPKTEPAWASALFSAEGRDGNGAGSLDSSRPSSAGMAPPHGYGEVWQSAPSRTGGGAGSPPVGSAASTLSDVSNGSAAVGIVSSREINEAEMYHRMASTSAPMDGGGSGRGVLSSQHYSDERNNRGFLNGLTSNGGGGGGGDFVSTFSSQQGNTWQEDDGSGNGGPADLQWERAERSRPRPPPLPAPLSQQSASSSGWGRPVGANSAEMHRHGGGGGGMMHAPPQQQRLPSILGSRR
ncbi:unnamed protein product, partial [Ectocarpus sp. 4 AP-2014]